jgi:hypothetical protein
MKSIFDVDISNEIINRIDQLTVQNSARWGRMQVAQMVRHCCLCEDYYFGKVQIKRSIIGLLIGQKALKAILRDDEATLNHNASSPKPFVVKEVIADLEAEKTEWKKKIHRYQELEVEIFTHWFFGKMTKEQLGQFVYKHCDHHLRQFGV